MKFCEKDLKIRINEEEEKLLDPDNKSFARSGSIKRVKSKDCTEVDATKDMIAMTIRGVQKLYTDFSSYSQFPFDTLNFNFRFEISHFQMEYRREKIEYRFDFYEQSNNSISVKEKCGYLPELKLNENREELKLIELKEKKPYYDTDRETWRNLYYYPGFTL